MWSDSVKICFIWFILGYILVKILLVNIMLFFFLWNKRYVWFLSKMFFDFRIFGIYILDSLFLFECDVVFFWYIYVFGDVSGVDVIGFLNDIFNKY